MPNLTCSKRNESIKLKALRRDGIAPAIIYGKNLKEAVKIQVTNKDMTQLMKETSIGSQVSVIVDGEEYLTMLKKVDYVPMSKTVQHVDFQVLTKGEKIKTSAPIHFINRDLVPVDASVQERLSAIEYEVLPSEIVEFFEVDLSVLTIGGDIKLEDLAVSKDEKFHFITALNATIVNLVAAKQVAEEVAEEEVVVTAE